MKKFVLMLLCLCLLPLSGLAAEKVENLTVEGKTMGFTYSFDYTEKYAVVKYSTPVESGRITLYSETGHFEGEGVLQCTYEESKLTVKVESLNQKELAKASGTVLPSEAPKAHTDQQPVEKTVRKITDLAGEPILGGAKFTFTAAGHESVLVKYKSSQEKGEMMLYPGENYAYELTLDMPYTYPKSNIFVEIYNAKGSSMMAEGQTTCGYELTAQETEVTPGRLSGVTVCIDPSHQGEHRTVSEPLGPGLNGKVSSSGGMARGTVTRRMESIVTLEVAYLLRDELMRQGATVVMTRETEEEWRSNLDRCQIAEDGGADFMLRLHCDNREDQNAKGISIYCPLKSDYAKAVAPYEEYKSWAIALLDAMKTSVGYELIDRTGRTTFNDNYVGNNWAKMPCFLIEMGFMSNPREDVLMSDVHYQQLLAEGMAQGVYDMAVMRGLVEEE